MPASNMSFASIKNNNQELSGVAAKQAFAEAKGEICRRIRDKILNQADSLAVKREFTDLYYQYYYKYCAIYMQQKQPLERVVFLQTANPAANKYYIPHTCAKFNRLNCFIHVHKGSITIGRINYDTDGDKFLETKETFLRSWPGPLDGGDIEIKRKVSDYLELLVQHDSQRQVRYVDNDDRRKVIVKLLTELVNRNGYIDAPGVTRLLLKPAQTEIRKDDSNRKPLETLQKYLLLGKRKEAIKFAEQVAMQMKNDTFWNHVFCLTFLDRYQPPSTSNFVKNGPRLRDDDMVASIDRYINSIVDTRLNTVYRSLLNRFLLSDPESLNLIKHPEVHNNDYDFAILSANDCEMEFDQTNEIYKLIVAVKKAITDPWSANSHLISFGFTIVDTDDMNETSEPEDPSHLSFQDGETSTSRTLKISNIDALIMNEVWEYCLNLARGTANFASYEYIINLIPYKLVFLSRLLDYGKYKMFECYLNSIRNALSKLKSQQLSSHKDERYDWDTIEMCVDYLVKIWADFCHASGALPLPFEPSQHTPVLDIDYETNSPQDPPKIPPNQTQSQSQLPHTPTYTVPAPVKSDYVDSGPESTSQPHQSTADHTSHLIRNSNYLPPPPSRNHYAAPPAPFNHQPIQEEPNEYDPDPVEPCEPSESRADLHYSQHPPPPSHQQPQQYQPNYDYSNESSRRASYEMNPSSPPSFVAQPNISTQDRTQGQKPLSSSPVYKNKDSRQSNSTIGDSFNAFSPINQYDDIPLKRDGPHGSLTMSGHVHDDAPQIQNRAQPTTSSAVNSNTVSNKNISQKGQQSENDGQETGYISKIARALLPKSNSRQMILPDDSKPSIIYDDQRGWVDTTNSASEDVGGLNEPPPMMAQPPPTYSFVPKTAKNRYPKTQF